MTGTPPGDARSAELFERLLRVNGLLRERASRFSATEMKHRPGPRKWTAGEVLGHLALTAQLYADAMEPALEKSRIARRATGPTGPGLSLLGRMLLWFLRPGASFPVKAPGKFKPGPSSARPLEELLEQHERLAAMLRDSGDIDLSRVRFWNPAIRVARMNVREAIEVLVSHAEHHLLQLDRIENAIKRRGG